MAAIGHKRATAEGIGHPPDRNAPSVGPVDARSLHSFDLVSFEEIAQRLSAQEGRPVSRSAAALICQRALAKVRAAYAEKGVTCVADLGVLPDDVGPADQRCEPPLPGI